MSETQPVRFKVSGRYFEMPFTEKEAKKLRIKLKKLEFNNEENRDEDKAHTLPAAPSKTLKEDEFWKKLYKLAPNTAIAWYNRAIEVFHKDHLESIGVIGPYPTKVEFNDILIDGLKYTFTKKNPAIKDPLEYIFAFFKDDNLKRKIEKLHNGYE